jgi:hypothetical protein
LENLHLAIANLPDEGLERLCRLKDELDRITSGQCNCRQIDRKRGGDVMLGQGLPVHVDGNSNRTLYLRDRLFEPERSSFESDDRVIKASLQHILAAARLVDPLHVGSNGSGCFSAMTGQLVQSGSKLARFPCDLLGLDGLVPSYDGDSALFDGDFEVLLQVTATWHDDLVHDIEDLRLPRLRSFGGRLQHVTRPFVSSTENVAHPALEAPTASAESPTAAATFASGISESASVGTTNHRPRCTRYSGRNSGHLIAMMMYATFERPLQFAAHLA